MYAVVCSLIIFGVLNWAFGDYMETLNFQLIKNPNVCIMSPDPVLEPRFYPDIYNATKSAVMEWETKLNAKGEWKFKIFEYPFQTHDTKYPSDFPSCHTFITFEQMIDGKALGTTGFDYSKSTHKYSYITTSLWHYPDTQFKIIIGKNSTQTYTFDPVPLPVNDIRNIVLHEFGHTLGLEHYYFNDPTCTYDKCADRSIMYHSLQTFQNVTKSVTSEDIQMVYRIYGEDGFTYPNPAWIPDSCHYYNGTLGGCE